MTREEAKEILTHNWTRVDNPNYSESELDEAFFMAIEALSADTVSREAHYDAVANRITDMEERGFVSVVRCKDCKWHKLTDNNETEVCTNKQWDISMAVYPIISADDFCSYGERKEK